MVLTGEAPRITVSLSEAVDQMGSVGLWVLLVISCAHQPVAAESYLFKLSSFDLQLLLVTVLPLPVEHR